MAEPIVSAWPNAEFAVVESVDHFLVGRAAAVAARTAAWVDHLLGELEDAG